jgi:hypothetical protein
LAGGDGDAGSIGQPDESGGLPQVVHLGDAPGRGQIIWMEDASRLAGLAGWLVVSSASWDGGR